MSDAPSWAAVGVSVISLGWTSWVYYRTRQEKREAAKEKRKEVARQNQATIDGAISRVVAQWAVTRLREVTWAIDPDLEELKESASRWRQGCSEPLAIVPDTSRAHQLIRETVKAVSEFEGVIDPMREGKIEVDATAVQDALVRMQNTVWESINELNTLKAFTSQGNTSRY